MADTANTGNEMHPHDDTTTIAPDAHTHAHTEDGDADADAGNDSTSEEYTQAHTHDRGVALRAQRIEALVEKRRQNVSYIRKLTSTKISSEDKRGTVDDCFWLNSVKIDAGTFREYTEGLPRARASQFFSLALSLGKLTTQSPEEGIVRALAQLFEGGSWAARTGMVCMYECLYGDTSVQGIIAW